MVQTVSVSLETAVVAYLYEKRVVSQNVRCRET